MDTSYKRKSATMSGTHERNVACDNGYSPRCGQQKCRGEELVHVDTTLGSNDSDANLGMCSAESGNDADSSAQKRFNVRNTTRNISTRVPKTTTHPGSAKLFRQSLAMIGTESLASRCSRRKSQIKQEKEKIGVSSYINPDATCDVPSQPSPNSFKKRKQENYADYKQNRIASATKTTQNLVPCAQEEFVTPIKCDYKHPGDENRIIDQGKGHKEVPDRHIFIHTSSPDRACTGDSLNASVCSIIEEHDRNVVLRHTDPSVLLANESFSDDDIGNYIMLSQEDYVIETGTSDVRRFVESSNYDSCASIRDIGESETNAGLIYKGTGSGDSRSVVSDSRNPELFNKSGPMNDIWRAGALFKNRMNQSKSRIPQLETLQFDPKITEDHIIEKTPNVAPSSPSKITATEVLDERKFDILDEIGEEDCVHSSLNAECKFYSTLRYDCSSTRIIQRDCENNKGVKNQHGMVMKNRGVIGKQSSPIVDVKLKSGKNFDWFEQEEVNESEKGPRKFIQTTGSTLDVVLPSSYGGAYATNNQTSRKDFPVCGEWLDTFKQRCSQYSKQFIDSHCHIDLTYDRCDFVGTYADFREAHRDTYPANYKGCIAIFCNPSTFGQNGFWKDLLSEKAVWGAVGCHPKNATRFSEHAEDGMIKMLQHEKMVALGEIGLDYSGKYYLNADIQRHVFAKQLTLAKKYGKPIVIHCREAEAECIQVMKQNDIEDEWIHRHCFTGSWDEACTWLKIFPNSYLGLTPLITHKDQRSAGPREVAKRIPLERLLLETDAPYFIPKQVSSHKMEYSHPGLAITVAEEVAKLRGTTVDNVLEQCLINTKKLYSIR